MDPDENFIEKALNLHVVSNFFFLFLTFTMYENYCKNSPIGEIKKIISWFDPGIILKLIFLSPNNWPIVVYVYIGL